MERLSILVGRLNKSSAPPKYFFRVPQVGRFMPLAGGISRLVEPALKVDQSDKENLDKGSKMLYIYIFSKDNKKSGRYLNK